MKRIIKKTLELLLFPLRYLPRKKSVVILQTYSPKIYCENTKYLFEYLSSRSSIEPYIVVNCPKIQAHLDSKSYSYISTNKPFHMLKIALRAGIVIDTGNAFFNILGLLGGKNVIKITTMHGSGPKATNGMYDSIDRNLAETFRLDRFDYINFPSSYSASMVGRSHFKLPRDKVVSLGYPRLDNYFDESFLIRTKSERKYCKKVFSDINESSKIILYTPTWRPYEYRFPILEMKDFDLGRFEEYLEKNDLYFCYSCHTANIPQNIPKNGKRIHFLEHKDDPFFDINIFMAEVDILLNDYSTTSTEFSILKRPQVFLMPDYDYYFEHKGFIEEYRDIMPGVEVRTLSDLESTLDSIINNRTEYLEKYELMRKKLLERYYDTSITNSSKHFSDFIESLQ